MPLFYHFEYNDIFAKAYVVTNQWGLVDTLEGAIAALATSSLRFGIINRSVKWCATGWFVSVVAFFIKPSGLLVMMALVGIATVEFCILFLSRPSSRRTILKFLAAVYSIGFSMYGLVLWLAFGSDYMSREVIAQAVKASQILISINQGSGPEGVAETPAVSSWSEEVERFKQFAYFERGVDKDGLELVSDGPVKLLRVADACKFTEALYGWANSIHWMDDFGDRNKAFLEKSPK
jgi:hypothetical protein